jgi:hypothetical protein
MPQLYQCVPGEFDVITSEVLIGGSLLIDRAGAQAQVFVGSSLLNDGTTWTGEPPVARMRTTVVSRSGSMATRLLAWLV